VKTNENKEIFGFLASSASIVTVPLAWMMAVVGERKEVSKNG
jgi:hypothetical protein